MPLCPQRPAGRVDGIGGEIPMKIIAADGGEEYEAYQPSGGPNAQQQFTCLPYHQYRTQGNVKTAKYEKVEYFS